MQGVNSHTSGPNPGDSDANGSLVPLHSRTRLRIAIVGAGFCGSTLAARLLRSACADRLEIVLIERSGVFGPGLAYGKARPTNLLNVPAGNMSALDDDAGHFLRWAQDIDPAIKTGDFLPRLLYGQYIKQLLAEAIEESRAVCTRVEGEAVDARRVAKVHPEAPTLNDGSSPTDQTEIVLASGERVRCDHAALCLGNFPPAPLPGVPKSLEDAGLVVRDPWSPLALANLDPDDDVLLVGTGLTMIDIASKLREAGHRGTVHAVSRRGLLPASHRGPSKPPLPRKPPERLADWDGTTLSLLRIMRGAISQAASEGIDWREVITSIRGITPSLWQRMDVEQRRKFIRHVRTYWETARHRLSPLVARGVHEAIAQGSVVIHAGRVTCATNPERERVGLLARYTTPTRSRSGFVDSATRRVGKIAVRLTPRGSSPDEAKTLLVSRIINCTGPECDAARSEDPLLQSLLAQGLIRPDPLRLGADCTPTGAVIDRQGNVSDSLSVVGPLRKGLLWETTAVPELRKQVSELAARLTAPLLVEVVVQGTREGVGNIAGRVN